MCLSLLCISLSVVQVALFPLLSKDPADFVCPVLCVGVLSVSIEIGRQCTHLELRNCCCKMCCTSCTCTNQRGPRLIVIGKRAWKKIFFWLRTGITRKSSHKTPACIDEVPMREHFYVVLHNTTLEVCFWSVLCLPSNLVCSFVAVHLLFSPSKLKPTKINVFM